MSKQQQISDEQQRAQQLLMKEAVENMHNEQLSLFWKKYKYLVYTLIVALVLGVAGIEAYKTHKSRVLLQDSDTYEQAAVLNAKGKTQEALDKYASLQNANTNYKYLSMLRRAGILFEQNENEQALSLLKTVYDDKSAPEVIRTIALFGYASNQIETLPPEQIHTMIVPYLVAGNPFYGSATELEIVLLVRQNKQNEAVSLIDQALTISSLSSATKERLTVMKQALTHK